MVTFAQLNLLHLLTTIGWRRWITLRSCQTATTCILRMLHGWKLVICKSTWTKWEKFWALHEIFTDVSRINHAKTTLINVEHDPITVLFICNSLLIWGSIRNLNVIYVYTWYNSYTLMVHVRKVRNTWTGRGKTNIWISQKSRTIV